MRSEGALPASLLHAVLLMIGNLYNNRESVAFASA
nr:MAG TPA: head-tail connector protein [Caudoviricetes sp.]